MKELERKVLLSALRTIEEDCFEIVGFINNCNLEYSCNQIWLENPNDFTNICLIGGSSLYYYTKNNNTNLLCNVLKQSLSFSHLVTYGISLENIQKEIKGTIQIEKFCKLSKTVEDKVDTSSVTRIKTTKEAELIYDLIQKIPQINPGISREACCNYLERPGKNYMIEENDLCVCTAMVNYETDYSGLVVSVGTEPSYRGKGYAIKIMTKLCRDMQKEGKDVYLYYDDPIAGHIYNKLGFKEVGRNAISVIKPELIKMKRI